MNINQVKTDSLKKGLTWAVLRKALCDDNYPLLMYLILYRALTEMHISIAEVEGGDVVPSYEVLVSYLKANIPLAYQDEWDRNMTEYTETYRVEGEYTHYTHLRRTKPRQNKGVIMTIHTNMIIHPPSWPKALVPNYEKCVDIGFTHAFPTKIELENCTLISFQELSSEDRHGRYGYFGNIFVQAKDPEEDIAAWITYRPNGTPFFCFRTYPPPLTDLHSITSELSEEEATRRMYLASLEYDEESARRKRHKDFTEREEHEKGSPSCVQQMTEPTEDKDDYQYDEYDDFDDARDATMHTHMREVMDRQAWGPRE